MGAVVAASGCGDDDDGGSEVETEGGAGSGGSGGTGGLAGSAGAAPDGGAGAGGGGSGGSAPCTTTTYGQGQACMDCIQQSCCSEATACENDADCSAMVTCARACPSPTDVGSQCVQDCASQHNLGGAAYNPLILCMGNACGQECAYL